MPIDKAQIEAYLNELGLSDTVRTSVLGELTANESAATQFVGQRLRHDDYTKKTQQTANERKQIEDHANAEIAKYAQQLGEAQTRINKIMSEFETESISRATAEARLNKVKTTYNLSDEDIPAVTTPAAAANTQPTIDIKAELAKMRTEIMTEFRSDLMSLPRLSILQNDIASRHQSITGKPLSREEFNAIIDKAEKERRPMEQVWQEEYKINELQTKQLIDNSVKEARQKWEDEQRVAATNAALASVSAASSPEQFTASPILQRRYESRAEQAPPVAPTQSTTSNSAPANSQPAVKLSGADRAASRFIERRANGIPLGAAPTPK